MLPLSAPNKSHNQILYAVNTMKNLFYEKRSINLCWNSYKYLTYRFWLSAQ